MDSENKTIEIKNDSYAQAVLSNRNQFRNGYFNTDLEKYLQGGLYAKVINKPVHDSLANGYDVTNDDGLIDNEVSRLKVNEALANAWISARLTGGACIIPIIEDGLTFADPLVPERIQRIAELRVYDASKVTTTGAYETDVFSPNYNKPLFYNITTNSGSFIVHYSRLIPLSGAQTSLVKTGINIDWIGVPVTRAIYKAIERYIEALNDSSYLVKYKQQAVYKMKGLSAAIQQKQEAAVKQRIDLVDEGRSLTNTIAIDSEDNYTILDPSVSGIKDVFDEFKQAICANSDVGLPLSMLFGNTKTGLSNTNEGDFRQYYDNCEGLRQRQVKPALEAIISLIAAQPEFRKYTDWNIEFNPMYEPTAKEAVDMKKTEAESISITIAALVNARSVGLITPEQAFDYIKEKGFFDTLDNDNVDSNTEFAKGLLNGE